MLLKQPTKFFRVAISVVGGLSLFLIPLIPVSAWTGPTDDPPNGNVAAPLNQSTLFSGDVISGRWNTLMITPDGCSAASLVGWNGTKLVCTSTLPSAGGISGTINYVSKFTSANTLGNSSIFDNGNVGINDSAPAATLVVRKPTSVVTATWLRVFDDSQNPEIQLQYSSDANGHWGIYNNQTEDAFRIWGGGNDRLAIKQNGNVGIGTNNPLVKLDVVGVVSSTGLQVNGAITASSLVGSGSRCLQASATGQISATASACGTGGSTGGGVNYGLAGQTAYYPANGTNVTGTSALIIDNANGRVAVGTATSANHRFLIKSANVLGYAMKILDSSGSIPLLSVVDFGTAAFNAMVGIGVDTPAEMLEVAAPVSAKTARVRITDKVNNPELQLQYGIGSEHWSVYTRNTEIAGQPGTADSLNIWGGTLDRMTINQWGMVGINNTDPQKRLHIGPGPTYYPASSLAITESPASIWNPGADSGIEFSVMGAGNYRNEAGAIGYTASLTNEDSRGFDFYVGRTDPPTVHGWGDGIPAMKIRSENAYVGIGTWMPLSSLVVSNQSIITKRSEIANKDVFVDINTNTTNYSNGLKWSVGVTTSSQDLWWLYRPAETSDLVLATGDNNPSNRLITFLSNGKIGIGTNSPVSTFNVVGDNASGYGITQPDGATAYIKNTHITSGLEYSFGLIGEGYTAGILGLSSSASGVGIFGLSSAGTAIQGRTEGGTAVSGDALDSNGFAGYFSGGKGVAISAGSNVNPGLQLSGGVNGTFMQLDRGGVYNGLFGVAGASAQLINNSAGGDIVLRSNGGKLILGTAYASPVITISGTNAGIGVTSPTQKLQVDGTVRATGYMAGSATGISRTVTVKGRTNSNCNLIFTNGLLTSSNCP
ncbi:MAG: hypothetical protein WC668_01325 [Patescibacteria group bacterium]|jgi:hypothetical protein